MIGYKATYGGKCKNITYKFRKTYTFNGNLVMCQQGFHFCKELEHVFDYYELTEESIKVYKIEVLGKVINRENKAVTDKFRLIKKVDISEWVKYDKNNNLIYSKFYDINTIPIILNKINTTKNISHMIKMEI